MIRGRSSPLSLDPASFSQVSFRSAEIRASWINKGQQKNPWKIFLDLIANEIRDDGKMVGKEVAFNFQRILFSVENKRFIDGMSRRQIEMSLFQSRLNYH